MTISKMDEVSDENEKQRLDVDETRQANRY